MMKKIRIRSFALVVVAALLVCAAASADPPARVGRLNLIQGSVSFMAGDTDEWITATVNYPLTAGDCLWTDASSRAEMHVGSTALRVSAETELGFLELDDAQVRIRLAQGLLSMRLRELEPGESFAIDTPAMSIALLTPGTYRIEVASGGGAKAIAYEGQMEAVVDGQAYPVRAEQAAFAIGSDPRSLRMGRAPARDGWDQWCAERDRREDHLASYQYVPRSMVGSEDLDGYGSWSVTVELGPVWIPHLLPAGWAPYRYGRWAWVRPWGWTWIDDMPWGFAPFHYGRWALVHGRWVWVPGSKMHRPVYAPALVVFTEPVANGRIGWFPLGPREPYIPAYPASRGYIKNVNSTQVVIGDRETIDASRIRYAHREAGQVYAQVPQQAPGQVRRVGDPRVGTPAPAAPRREDRPAAAKTLLDAVAQLAQATQERRSVHSQEPKVSRGREPTAQQKLQKVGKKKRLANGQLVWVEELAPAD